jgi:hypothetical protein
VWCAGHGSLYDPTPVSYGRVPFYIYDCTCNGKLSELSPGQQQHPTAGKHIVFEGRGSIALDALAQFIASAHHRGELEELIDRGYRLQGRKPPK